MVKDIVEFLIVPSLKNKATYSLTIAAICLSLWMSVDTSGPLFISSPTSGLPRHKENREFGGPFFQAGKTQGICQKILKIYFYIGNLTPTQGKFGDEKRNNELVI